MQLKTRIRSTIMRLLGSAWYLERLRTRARARRERRGEAPAVLFFHQVDDPYSHLAVEHLGTLTAAYGLRFKPYLVSAPEDAFKGSTDHFATWALRDAVSVAGDYGVEFTPGDYPEATAVRRANAQLACHLDDPDFAIQATRIGRALWQHDPISAPGDPAAGDRALTEGNALRKRLGHYLGGMFYFDGEWFWGIDRIHSLEARLKAEAFAAPDAALCVPEPTPPDTSGYTASHITLEYFPSLRSPYTAVGHQRVLDLAARSGVNLVLRPVLPMMMRGVPAPGAKQRYIILDAAREARARKVPFGRFVDPFGDPVRRAFALYPSAVKLGRGMEFVTAYLAAAWAEGVDITSDTGLRQVAERAGLDWQALRTSAAGEDWQGLLDRNVSDMLAAGLWGVPSFRISGGGPPPYACWGQDRIWRLEAEIARRARPPTGGT